MKRIFVKSVNWVGDAVLATPMLRALRRGFPEAHITLLARPWVADVFEANPDVDRLWVADETASFRRFREIAARLRKERFDLGIALPNSFGAALLMTLGRVRRRVGYRRDARGLLLTDPVPVTPEILRVHQVEYYMNLLQNLCDVGGVERELVVPVAPGARERVDEMLGRHDINGSVRLAAICPGATYGTAKRWIPERFAAVADHIQARWGARVAVVGSESERDIGEEVARQVKHPVAVLSGKMPLRGLIALCERLRLFVTNDSGAMHVAAARGVPLVAVFGPTDWATTAPYGPRAIIVRTDAPCEANPCLQRDCSRDHNCMKSVSVEDVIEAVDRQMEDSSLEERTGESPQTRRREEIERPPPFPALPTPMPQIEKLTVLHVDTGREWRGGQNQALLLCKGLSRVEGVVQTLVSQPDSPLSKRAAEEGVDVVAFPMRGEWDFGAAWRLRRLIRARGAGLVHTHDAHAHALGWMASTGLTDVSLVAARRVDFEVSHNPFSRRKYLSPRVHYLAISTGVRDVLLRGGVAADRIIVVPSGVDPERFSFKAPREKMRGELGVANEAPVVGTVGSLVDHKGHRYLIDAAPLVLERFPSAEFVIVGEGELRRDLERRIREKKLGRKIHLVGYRQDVETFLSSFDVFALSSHLEGLCTSLIDAMLFRLPIVGTRTGGVPDLVRDGETGLLVEPKDPGALARAIVRLLANQQLGSRLGTAARKRALDRFTCGAMVEGTLQAYRCIMGGGSCF